MNGNSSDSLYADEYLIFYTPMSIFVTHFAEQIKTILALERDPNLSPEQLITKKHEYITDIQNAVSKIAEIFQSMAGSIKNIDQPIFPVPSGSMYVFNASLKMIATYSKMLNQTARLLDSGNKYAFLLYPAMTDIIHTDVFLKKREQSGKVIVVTFPEGLTEQTAVIPILFHEAFHVIERQYRFRKLRASCLLENICSNLKELIFKNTVLLNADNEDYIKNSLINKWFQSSMEYKQTQIENYNETDKELYAPNLKQSTAEFFTEALTGIDTKIYNDILQELYDQKNSSNNDSFHTFCSISNTIYAITASIKQNILNNITNNILGKLCSSYVTVYREGYADIAACLFLQLSPKLYDKAFEISCRFSFSENQYIDRERLVRQYIVSRALGEIITNTSLRKEWGFKASELLEKLKSLNASSSRLSDTELSSGTAVISIEKTSLDTYHEYFVCVASYLQNYFESIANISMIRNNIRKMIEHDESVMTDIFLGQFDFTK